jgi:hypothetical protein
MDATTPAAQLAAEPTRIIRADEDHQPFGVFYDGPALPQHVVDMDGVPLGEPMIAVKDQAGEWGLWPADELDD